MEIKRDKTEPEHRNSAATLRLKSQQKQYA